MKKSQLQTVYNNEKLELKSKYCASVLISKMASSGILGREGFDHHTQAIASLLAAIPASPFSSSLWTLFLQPTFGSIWIIRPMCLFLFRSFASCSEEGIAFRWRPEMLSKFANLPTRKAWATRESDAITERTGSWKSSGWCGDPWREDRGCGNYRASPRDPYARRERAGRYARVYWYP